MSTEQKLLAVFIGISIINWAGLLILLGMVQEIAKRIKGE